jgi:hypothetical protein
MKIFYSFWAPRFEQNLLWLEAGLHSWWVLDSSKTSFGVAQQVALKKREPGRSRVKALFNSAVERIDGLPSIQVPWRRDHQSAHRSLTNP